MQQSYTGAAVRSRRKARGLTLRALAADCGCSHTAIHKIEQGEFTPCDDLAVTVAAVLGISAAQILHFARVDRGYADRAYRMVTR